MPGEEYLVALGHIQGDHGPPSEHVYAAAASPPPGDANQAASGGGSNTNTAKRRSLWSGFKQIFRGRHSASSIHSSGYGSVDRSGGKHGREPPQSLSYSCLGGNGRSRQMTDEEDIYRDINSFIVILGWLPSRFQSVWLFIKKGNQNKTSPHFLSFIWLFLIHFFQSLRFTICAKQGF